MDSGHTRVDEAHPGPIAKTAVATSAAVQAGAVVAVLVLRALSEGGVTDRLGAVPLAVIYSLPAVLAVLALRGRGPLLLPAGLASLVLAVFPFSLHSFVYGPIGLVYLVALASWPTRRHGGARAAAAAAVVPLLLVAGFLALVVHEDPVCYTRHASGEITFERDPDQAMSGAQTIEAGSGVVERGCSSDTVVWWEAAVSLTLSAASLSAGVLLVPIADGTGEES